MRFIPFGFFNKQDVTPQVTPTPTVTPTPSITPTNTVTPTITSTNTPTPTPTSLPGYINLISDSVYVYQYGLSGNTNTLIFDPATELINDIAIGNINFYTLISTDAYATGFTINQYTSTLSPLSITSGITNSWTVLNGDYPGLDNSFGLEVKDNNTLLLGGSSIYSFNISGSTFTKLFDLPYPESYVIGDMIYNPYTSRLIVLTYGQTFTDFYISEFYLNGTLYAEYNITGDFSGDTPGSLFVNNSNLYIVTTNNGYVYQLNLSTSVPTYIQTMTGTTYGYGAGMAASNQNNNVSLSPNPTPTPTPTTILYDYYLADEYSCSPCTFVQSNVPVVFLAGTSINTTNWYYARLDATPFVYKNFTSTTPGVSAILVTTGAGTNCSSVCPV